MSKKDKLKVIIAGVILLVIILSAVVIYGNKNFYQNNEVIDNLVQKAQKTLKPTAIPVQNIKDKKQTNLLVLGDSIAASYGITDENSKWINRIKSGLENKYHFAVTVEAFDDLLNNTFGGWIDYCSEVQKSEVFYDIAIICLGKNDLNYDDLQFAAVYEKIVQNLLRSNPNMKIVAVAQYGIKDPEYYKKVKKISERYRLIYADMPELIKNSGKPPESLFLEGVFPNNIGCEIYGNTILKLLSDKFDTNTVANVTSISTIYPENGLYANYYRIGLFGNGFSKNDKVDIEGRRYLHGETVGDFLETNVLSSIIGIYTLATPSSGILKLYINDVFETEIDLYSAVTSNKKFFISRKKDYSNYRLRMEISNKKNPTSSGNQAHVFGVITNTKENDNK